MGSLAEMWHREEFLQEEEQMNGQEKAKVFFLFSFLLGNFNAFNLFSLAMSSGFLSRKLRG